MTNLKYLLESQIQEIQQEKIPLNKSIQSLNKQITDIKGDLKSQRNIIVNKDLELNKKEMKLHSQIKNVKLLEQMTRSLKQEFMILSGLIDNNDKENQKVLKDRLNIAYQKYRLSEN